MVKPGHAPRGLLALLAAWAVGVPAMLHAVGGKEVQTGAWVHFTLVAAGALIAAFAAVGLTVAGARANDGRTVLLGAAFSTMTALLAIHGLATPGIIVGQNGVIALAGAASLPAGGAVLALTAVPALRRPLRMRPVLAIQTGLAAVILLLGGVGLCFPSVVPNVPAAGSPPALILMGVGLAFYALLALRAVRTYTLTHRTTDLLVFVGCVWLGWALVPQRSWATARSPSTSATRWSCWASRSSASRPRSTCARAAPRGRSSATSRRRSSSAPRRRSSARACAR
jgi:hypothetical protein